MIPGQQFLSTYRNKLLASAGKDAQGRPRLQKEPGVAYQTGVNQPKVSPHPGVAYVANQQQVSVPPNTQEALQAAINWSRLQQGKGKLGMSGNQQQIMQVLSKEQNQKIYG